MAGLRCYGKYNEQDYSMDAPFHDNLLYGVPIAIGCLSGWIRENPVYKDKHINGCSGGVVALIC